MAACTAQFGKEGLCAPLRAICVLILIASLIGCTSSNRAPPPFEIPLAQTSTTHYIGTPLSGPRTGNIADISFTDAIDLHATWFAIEQFKGNNLPLLASNARLITATQGGAAILPSGSLTSNARIVWTNSTNDQSTQQFMGPGRRANLGESQAALPRGVTVSFRAIDGGGLTDQTLIRQELRFLEVSVARLPHPEGASEKLQIAVSVEDDQPNGKTSSADATPKIFQLETAVLEHSIERYPTTLLVIVPFNFTGPPSQAAAAVITIAPATANADFAKAVSRCKLDLQSADAEHSNAPIWTEGLKRGLDSLDDPDRRRAGLVFLASQSGAKICLDVASVCDDALLEQISKQIQTIAPVALNDLNIDQFAWIMDRSAIAAMQPKLSAATLPAELFAILTLHMGEPGRHAASVDAIMRGATSQQDLLRRLIAENYIYLEDSSPASRMRAYRWLQSHNIAPAGFDPLAPPRQRRIALDKALDAGPTTLPAGGAP